VKISLFNKINDVLIVDTCKQISQSRDIDSEIFTSDAFQIGAGAFQQNNYVYGKWQIA